jgi:hypothetical protein
MARRPEESPKFQDPPLENNHFYIDEDGVMHYDLFEDDIDASSIQFRDVNLDDTVADLKNILK